MAGNRRTGRPSSRAGLAMAWRSFAISSPMNSMATSTWRSLPRESGVAFDIPVSQLTNGRSARRRTQWIGFSANQFMIAHQDKCAGPIQRGHFFFRHTAILTADGRAPDHSDGRRLLRIIASKCRAFRARLRRLAAKVLPPPPSAEDRSDSFFARVWRVLPWNPRCRFECRLSRQRIPYNTAAHPGQSAHPCSSE